MKPVVIFQHITCEGPAYLGSFFATREISYRIIRINREEQVPDSLVEVAIHLLREWVDYYADDLKNPSDSVQLLAG